MTSDLMLFLAACICKQAAIHDPPLYIDPEVAVCLLWDRESCMQSLWCYLVPLQYVMDNNIYYRRAIDFAFEIDVQLDCVIAGGWGWGGPVWALWAVCLCPVAHEWQRRSSVMTDGRSGWWQKSVAPSYNKEITWVVDRQFVQFEGHFSAWLVSSACCRW